MEIWHKRMKELRKNSDTTLKDMAKVIGVSEATVQRYECGKIQEVPYNVIIAYAEKFHVTPSYIMGWTNTPNQKQLNLYDLADDKDSADALRAEQFEIKYDLEFKKKSASITKEEYIVLECYRSLSDHEKEMVKRMIAYAEKYEELYGKGIHKS